MPLLILVELTDTAPVKTLTAIQDMEGVRSVHTRNMPSADIKRMMHEAPREEAREEASAAPSNGTLRDLILAHLVRHRTDEYAGIVAMLEASGRAAGSGSPTLNKMQHDGLVKNSERGWSITAKGRKAAGAPAAPAKINGVGSGNWKRRGGFGNAEVLAMLRKSSDGTRTLDTIAKAFVEHGKSRDQARGTIERLKVKKLVTTAVAKDGVRIVKLLRENANATS